MLIGYDFKVEH